MNIISPLLVGNVLIKLHYPWLIGYRFNVMIKFRFYCLSHASDLLQGNTIIFSNLCWYYQFISLGRIFKINRQSADNSITFMQGIVIYTSNERICTVSWVAQIQRGGGGGGGSVGVFCTRCSCRLSGCRKGVLDSFIIITKLRYDLSFFSLTSPAGRLLAVDCNWRI